MTYIKNRFIDETSKVVSEWTVSFNKEAYTDKTRFKYLNNIADCKYQKNTLM